MLQPDFGSAMVITELWLGMALVAGISKRHILIVAGVGIVVFLIAWFALLSRIKKREL